MFHLCVCWRASLGLWLLIIVSCVQSRFFLSCGLLTHTCLVMCCEPWACARPVRILPQAGRLSEQECDMFHRILMFIKYLCCCHSWLNKLIYSEAWVSIIALFQNLPTVVLGDKTTPHSSAFEDTVDGPQTGGCWTSYSSAVSEESPVLGVSSSLPRGGMGLPVVDPNQILVIRICMTLGFK